MTTSSREITFNGRRFTLSLTKTSDIEALLTLTYNDMTTSGRALVNWDDMQDRFDRYGDADAAARNFAAVVVPREIRNAYGTPYNRGYWDYLPTPEYTKYFELFAEILVANERICETCGGSGHDERATHVTCDYQRCEVTGVQGFDMRQVTVYSGQRLRSNKIVYYCKYHIEHPTHIERLGAEECLLCARLYVTEDMITANVLDSTQLSPQVKKGQVCPRCANQAMTCIEGDHFVMGSTKIINYPELGADAICYHCLSRKNLLKTTASWDWVPPLDFHPAVPTNPKKPLYIGIEIEMSFKDETPEVLKELFMGNLEEGKFWAKGDSSVYNGIEVVTHPMEPELFLDDKYMQWDLFEYILKHGAYGTHSSTGQHIHMSKEAFSTAHLWKMLQIHKRLPQFCGLVGGRGTTAGYGSLEEYIGISHGAIKAIAKAKGKAGRNGMGRCGVNLAPEYTIELRYPAGTTKPAYIKKNAEWARALFDFTDYLDVKDIKDGAIDNPGYFLWWLNENQDRFINLLEWIDKEIPRPIALRERAL